MRPLRTSPSLSLNQIFTWTEGKLNALLQRSLAFSSHFHDPRDSNTETLLWLGEYFYVSAHQSQKINGYGFSLNYIPQGLFMYLKHKFSFATGLKKKGGGVGEDKWAPFKIHKMCSSCYIDSMGQFPSSLFLAVSFREKWVTSYPLLERSMKKYVTYYSYSIFLWVKVNIPKFCKSK